MQLSITMWKLVAMQKCHLATGDEAKEEVESDVGVVGTKDLTLSRTALGLVRLGLIRDLVDHLKQ